MPVAALLADTAITVAAWLVTLVTAILDAVAATLTAVLT